MKVFIQTIIALLIIINVSSAQTNYYVDGALGSDIPGNGLRTGASAWKTIEYAVNNVADPATEPIIINIVDGTYDLNNNQIDIGRIFTNLTILGGSTNGTIVQASTDTSLSSARVFEIYPGNTVSIKNMTVRHGKVPKNGGGIYNRGTLTIDYCKITNNILTETRGVGAGVGNFNGVLTITNSTISYNKTYNINEGCPGGGVGASGGITVINNSTISYNQAASGAGIAIILNKTDENGNAIFEMTNSTISENLAGFNGGAMRIALFNNPTYNIITNINSCTIYKNHADSGYGGILLSSQTDFNIKNTILAGNTAGPTFTSNDLKGLNSHYTITSGDNNLIQTNINVTINGFTANNIYNQEANCLTLADNNTTNGTHTCATLFGSPAINAIPGGNGAPPQDQRGKERNGDYDIGAFEYSSPSDVDGEKQLPNNFSLKQNHPNPFNPSTKISWQSPVGSWQTLKVFDVLGNEVVTLVDEYRPVGEYEVEFQTSIGNRQLASGVYYYRLQAGEYVQTKKMILLK
ncbi:MAG: choice-of-anchor Q domain-containing protein [Ignavibacteriota bacterium]